jgi:hypothetical protein
MGRGCEITKHLKIAYGHLFYYSNVFDVGMFVWKKMVRWWLYEDTSDGSYHPGRPSGPKKSSKEPATTTEGQGQEQEHDGTKGGEAQERGNQTLEMILEHGLQLFVISLGDGGPGLHRREGMAITMMWRECGTAVQEKMANILMSRWHLRGNYRQRSCALSSIGHHGFQDNRLCNCRHYPRSPTPPELHLLYECGTSPHEGRDEVPTQSSKQLLQLRR